MYIAIYANVTVDLQKDVFLFFVVLLLHLQFRCHRLETVPIPRWWKQLPQASASVDADIAVLISMGEYS